MVDDVIVDDIVVDKVDVGFHEKDDQADWLEFNCGN